MDFPSPKIQVDLAMARKKTKRKLAHLRLPKQGQLNLRHEGRYFDLRSIFDRLNQRYFRGPLGGSEVTWGRTRKHRAKDYLTYGTSQEEDRIIRINRLFVPPFVPLWFL